MNFSSIFSFLKKNLLLAIFVFAILLRFAFLKNNSIFFYFDQARDAFVSRSIIEERDFKIQGPSVSGTGDSVYHGVIYYYLMAPIYTLSGGSPIFASYLLAIIGSLSIFVVYALAKNLFQSKKIALLAAFFVAISATSAQAQVWLSNPQLLSIFLLLAYLYLWKIFFATERATKVWEYALFGFIVALSVQSALQSIVFLGSVLLASIYLIALEKKIKIFSLTQILAFSTSFFLGISSILLTELLMWKRGILSFNSLNLGDHASSISVTALAKIAAKYFSLTRAFLAPGANLFVFLLLLIPIVIFLYRAKKKQIIFLLLFFLSPLWLLIWHYRDPNHSFIGLELVIYLAFSAGLWQLFAWKSWGKLAATTLLILFSYFQVTELYGQNLARAQHFGIQKGALLAEQLALMDKTYQIANGQSFTFSTLTSPYAINSTWSYLYNWYASSRQVIKPVFIGMPQAGYPGGNVLPEASQSAELHFTIIEPDTTLSETQIAEFLEEQNQLAGEIVQEWSMGELRLQLR